ncbi:F-box domain-containing protein [Caenorhabditis elegans]|uniref:F-box domain-containing protein n=1 Tax=Caenorhabditis elegans TaxID=6239 RepID=Q17783_CAEEL|nr:F-box domain-containing protein [Caenorhabditis elegans]CCD63528.1 F-box domain-containing protein [Caenorhabditis elegans]|eukprot:NP_495551.1 Uncharacterized protein CELE_C07D10.1 [Caenorhabditis elegans]
MSSSCRRIDDVALWKVFKSVDAATLQRCRRVCTKWNSEILRLNEYTSKFTPCSLMMEINAKKFKISLGNLKSRNCLEIDSIKFNEIQKSLRHVAPPATLMIYLSCDSESSAIEEVMGGATERWCSEIRELEFVTHNPNLKISSILKLLERFPNLIRFSLSHCFTEFVSIGEIFKKLSHLQYLRVYDFVGSSESGQSSGLVFDDNAVIQLMKNQTGSRKIQKIELFNIKVTVSRHTMIESLRKLARLPVQSEIFNKPILTEKNKDNQSIHLLFENCIWETIKELNLLSDIIRIASQFCFPIQQHEDNFLKGDFRFSIFDTNFVLKFVV